MASIVENYSVAWDGYANNCSVSFTKLLKRMDMADVTLVANGVKIKAHRFVLSAISPYFDELFADMPFNERAFVVLKDVSQQTLNDLITFMYHGDVKVKQENLKVFFKTAKSFKIKGLTDAESLFSNTFGSAPPHTASQFQTIQTVRVQSPEKVSSSETRQSAQPISNNLPVEGHANANAQIKTEKGEDDPQLVLNGVEAEGGNNESNHNDESVEQGQQLAVKRERPSSSHASEIAPKVKRAKQLNRNDLIGYNIIADIQTNAKGKENLFYADHKFSRGAKGALGSQRWSCSKASNTKCRAAMSTLDVGGITMMKVLFGEHSH